MARALRQALKIKRGLTKEVNTQMIRGSPEVFHTSPKMGTYEMVM